PDYPAERLAFLMEDSDVRCVVGDEATVGRLPAHLVACSLIVPPSTGGEALPSDIPLVPGLGGEALAYVMYTSGSTGRPKGAAVPHQAVVRLVRETGYMRFGPDHVFLQLAPISFDASTLEIWGALLHGSRLVIMPPQAVSLAELGRAIEQHGVTTLWLTAGLFHQLVEHHLELLRPVRQLLAGGDVLSVPHVRKVLAGLPDTQLINGYGPTENTTFTCCHPVGPEHLDTSVPIGRPIANTWVHLLDDQGQPVPIGVAGELCTGGAGLARGYLGRPELTADRFIPDPLSGPESRLYRTGDLARRLPDGTVEFLGRLDHQVKIRGFRIELGEIEARLAEHPAVLQSVVLAREDVPGDRRVVAYILQQSVETPQDAGTDSPGADSRGVSPDSVTGWSNLFDDIYREEAAGADPTFNIIGWNSTYTGQPLPRPEMEEWLDDTIGRIETLAPKRVLEIGCGTGMILFKIAPHAELYTGTDVSARALAYIEGLLGRVPGIDPSRIQLVRGSAAQLDGFPAGSFDTAVVNSVAQYFPSADYLAAVVERAVELVRPGGALFLGDLRSLPLLEAFHTSLELFQAEPEMPLPRLRDKIRSRRLHENELVIDPAFFTALRRRLPRIARVEIHPKRGQAHNELTGFRYQAVLRIGERTETADIAWTDWQEERLTLDGLRQLLAHGGPKVLALRNI
ncbi:MAG TPA: amino acid adenylation domain-containing protein, partial [Thermoanaerobaculia bacterium]